MPHLPARFAAVILAFAPLFVHRSWRHAEVLLIGAILTPGRRTVTSLLRIIGLSRERRFVNYHRVLSRAAWCPPVGARILLGLLARRLRAARSGGAGPRRHDRAPARQAHRGQGHLPRPRALVGHAHFVKASGLRWMSLMLLAADPVGRAGLGAAVPHRARPLRARTAASGAPAQDAARRRAATGPAGAPLAAGRDLVLVGDSGFSALLFLDAMRRGGVTAITRLRLDAALYEPAPPRAPGTIGRPRTKGARLPTLAGRVGGRGTPWQARRRAGLVRRGRAHGRDRLGHRRLAARRPAGRAAPLGADPRPRGPLRPAGAALHRPRARPAPDRRLVRAALAASRSPSRRRVPTSASRRSGSGPTRPSPAPRPACSPCSRSSPCLPPGSAPRAAPAVATAAWYPKPRPTFTDALAAVRRDVWANQGFFTSAMRRRRRNFHPT